MHAVTSATNCCNPTGMDVLPEVRLQNSYRLARDLDLDLRGRLGVARTIPHLRHVEATVLDLSGALFWLELDHAGITVGSNDA